MANKKKYIFHSMGASVVIFWLIMMSLLIKNQFLHDNPPAFVNPVNNSAIGSAQREWKEIFLGDKKVGYSVSSINPVDSGYFIQEEISLRMNLMGFEKGLSVITQSGVDKEFILKNFFFKMSSGIINYTAFGEVEGKKITIRTGDKRHRSKKVIDLKSSPMISSGISHMFKTVEIKVGDTHRSVFFDPVMMARTETMFTVAAKENIKIRNITYEAYRIETEMWGNRLRFWIDMDGSILREDGFLGLSMIKSSAANAPLDLETADADDFYEISAVSVDKKIPDPERLRDIRFRVIYEGAGDIGAERLNDSIRQKYDNGTLEIKREVVPSNGGYVLPFDLKNGDFQAFLEPEINIESDAKEIIDRAGKITGDEGDPVTAARKIMEWVYGNVEKRPVVNIPSALEVLDSRTGDCNEHATLCAALLRAAGIPSRICVGLVYTRERFYYHAWNEAWLGEWITLDATLNQMPADVSHIMLVRGNLDKQVEITGLIGKLSLEVIDYTYD